MELPEGWKNLTIGDIGKVRGGKRLPKGETYSESATYFPYIRVTDFENLTVKQNKLKYLSEETQSKIKNYTISSNDVFISIAGTIGQVGIVPHSLDGANLTENAAKITDLKLTYNKYLAYALSSQFSQRQIQNHTIATTQPKLSLFRIEKIIIPHPSLPEQYQIVQKIEELFSELDKGIENLKTAQEQLKVYRQAVLKWAFEGKLTNENVKDGELPEGWEWVTFADVCYKIGDIDHKMPKTTPTGYPYLSTKDFSDDLKISFDRAKFISKEDYLALSRKIKPEFGDIIFPRYGTIGKNILIDFNADFLVSYSCAIIKPNTQMVDSKYLYFYSLSPHTTNEIRKYVVETTQANIGIASIKKFRLSLPALKEQQNIVQNLESRLSVCDKLEETIITSLQQAEALKQSILKKAFEGKLIKADKPPEQAKIISIESKDSWQRKVLAGHIIYAFQKGGYIGRTKLQKILYLCEQHAQLDFDTQYVKEAAGPLDSKFLYSFLNEGKQKKWIEETPVGNGFKYEPSSSISELTTDYPKYFRSSSSKINFVIKLLKDTDTDAAELIATIYAIWNNYLIIGSDLHFSQLIPEVYKWSETKTKFTGNKIIKTWNWMKGAGLIPNGHGKLIDRQ